MTFSLECRACGHSNRVDSSLVGKRVKCRGCGAALAVSDPRKSSDAPSGSSARLKFNCPACGKEFATKPELAGKKLRCSGCQKVILVPAGAQRLRSGHHADPREPMVSRPWKRHRVVRKCGTHSRGCEPMVSRPRRRHHRVRPVSLTVTATPTAQHQFLPLLTSITRITKSLRSQAISG